MYLPKAVLVDVILGGSRGKSRGIVEIILVVEKNENVNCCIVRLVYILKDVSGSRTVNCENFTKRFYDLQKIYLDIQIINLVFT